MDNILELLDGAIEKHGFDGVVDYMSINKNTLSRWYKLNSVPSYYYFDLCSLNEIDVNYDDFSFAEKDQFFTHKDTAKYCLGILKEKLVELDVDSKEYIFIEPSAGDGSFYNYLPVDRKIGLDIQPRIAGLKSENYLNWTPDDLSKKYIVVGNPPFGLRGNLALRFINHSSKFSEFVAFILPPLFYSTGKGSCMARVKDMNLIHSEEISPKFLYPDGKEVSVNCIFQIWSKNFSSNILRDSCSEYIKIYSLSDGGTSGTTRNKKMLNECDIYLPSTCFSNNMKVFYDFESLPHRRGYGIKILKDFDRVKNVIESTNWLEKSFKSTNSATNLRMSIIEDVLIENNIKN
jgi:hypothetical protein